MITRILESEIIKDLSYFPAVALIGPRQSGKTTLAKALTTRLDKPAVYLDLESAADVYRLQEPETFFLRHENACIVIDEVQLSPTLFPLLRSVIDKNRVRARFIKK